MHLTFTTARRNPNDLIKGSTTPAFQATVACRLLMPIETAQQLARTLVESLIKASQQARAMPEPVTEPTDKFDDWPDRLSRDNPRFRS